MNLLKKENEINARLKQIDPRYSIANLKLALEGQYDFDIGRAFSRKDSIAVEKVFREVLGIGVRAKRNKRGFAKALL